MSSSSPNAKSAKSVKSAKAVKSVKTVKSVKSEIIDLSTVSANVQPLIEKGRNTCSNCSASIRVRYVYPVNDRHALCELCNIIYKYCARSGHTGIVCRTTMSQLDIIRNTCIMLKTHRRIPKINEIDPNARIVECATPVLLKCIKLNRELFADYQLFFTDMIDYDGFTFFSMFVRPIKHAEYAFFDIANRDVQKTELSTEQSTYIKNHNIEKAEQIDYNPFEAKQSASILEGRKNL